LLQRLQITAILVTHDYADALALGQHILVMDRGQPVQFGTREELLFAPRSQFVADFTGVNYFEGQVVGNGQQPREIQVGATRLYATTEAQGEVSVSFFPSEVMLSVEEPHTSARNVLHGPVREIVHLGDRLRVHVDAALPVVAEVTAESFAALELEEGKDVYAFFKATAVRVSD
jgi:molybdopterin-binding protein